MDKKNIVSIDEKQKTDLKQTDKRKAKRKLFFYLFIFLILILIIIYLQSSLSHVKEVKVKDNQVLSESTIVDMSKIDTETNIWNLSTNKKEFELEKHPIIKSVKIERDLPSTVMIDITEYKVLGYIKSKKDYQAILEDGNIIKNEKNIFDYSNAPLLHGFKDKKLLKRMAEELNELPENIFQMISEIYWMPDKNNEYKIEMFMVDGFVVDTTIRGFSENMKVYPSIVLQLDSTKQGIIHIGKGSYFEEKKYKN